MKFELDKQTKNDLEIFNNEDSSIFSYYDMTKTKGGKNCLYEIMNNPLTDISEIKNRCELIKFFHSSDFELAISYSQLEYIEHYLKLGTNSLNDNIFSSLINHLSYKIKPSNDYYLISKGIEELVILLKQLNKKLKEKLKNIPELLKKEIQTIDNLIKNPFLIKYINSSKELKFNDLNKLDAFFRNSYLKELVNLIQSVYHIDAFISVAGTAKKNNLTFPVYIESEKPQLNVIGLFHPLLKKAKSYDFEIDKKSNMFFLTGPNMAGKSTFLKSIGLSVFLSHLGFPVPASKMTTSIYNGIVSTINLSDNLNKGLSHFYSEVKRVKETALKLKENKNLLVIFDELFRGTNVKDASDASLLIIESFSKIKKSTFFVSTHITEVATELSKSDNIQFKYFNSKLVDNKPTYDYKLKEGISKERLGMYIVQNEKIVEILETIT
ncbi:MutS-related protein [Algibacter sp. R77976]|uniref:MutS-related protein n=1 Tax=Algibacter sp. R77976 TaxID=3093873 RepID=UPI0037C68473